MSAMADIFLHQIVYSDETARTADPGFRLLDNRDNLRPDWFEYWPIRRFLLTTPLDEQAFYGFFSPKFREKTQLGHDDVVAFIRAREAEADVFLFSPQVDMGAFFLNIFEQGDVFDPGLLAAYARLLEATGRHEDLSSLVMDSRQIVFSNYFVARPAFWREWLRINEVLFAIAETPTHPLASEFRKQTSYPGAVERKVFMQERTASYLLTTQSRWRTAHANPYAMAWSASPMHLFPAEAAMSDALKIAHKVSGHPIYLETFATLRKKVFFSPSSPASGG
jgi:hypothetical protein